jgi:hypothetical protein
LERRANLEGVSYTIPVIQRANKEIKRQATEEFANKESHAVELAKFKERLKIIVDSMDSIAKDNNVSHADRLNAERIKLDALALLRDAIEASKIVIFNHL